MPLPERRITFLLDTTKVLFASLDYERTLQKVADLCVPDVADWCTVTLLQPDGSLKAVAIAHKDPAWREAARRWSEKFVPHVDDPQGMGAVARTGKPLLVPEITPAMLDAAARGDEHRRLIRSLAPRSALLVPLVAHGRSIGVLGLTQIENGRPFDEEDLEFAEQLALRAAIAVENARLFAAEREARAAAERSLDRLARLQRATVALARASTPAQVARAVVEDVVAAVGARAASLALLAPDGALLRVEGASGARDVPLSSPSPLARAVREGKPVLLRDADDLARHGPDAATELPPGHSWACLPLTDGYAAQGAVAFAFDRSGELPPEERPFVETLVEQAGQAMARARLEEAALLQRALLESQNEAALDGIFFQGADGRAAFYNRRLLEMWGVDESVPRGATVEERMSRVLDRFADPRSFVEKVLQLEKDRDATFRDDIRLADGRIFDCYAAPVRTRDGKHAGRVWFYRDVTDRRRMAEELAAARRHLAQGEKLAALGTLVSGVAHEVRTPLAYLSNEAHLLHRWVERLPPQGAPLAPEDLARLRESAASILEGADRINRLVSDLRRFSRLDPGAREPVDVDEAVAAAVDLFEATHRGRARVERDLAARRRVRVDRVQLQQVVLNLLENAADVTPPGRPVRVRTRGEDGAALVAVEDEGPGVPPEVQARMWEPFFTTKPEGTGLGLSIVRRIVQAHDGTVRCESEPGKGARFVARLPAA